MDVGDTEDDDQHIAAGAQMNFTAKLVRPDSITADPGNTSVAALVDKHGRNFDDRRQYTRQGYK